MQVRALPFEQSSVAELVQAPVKHKKYLALQTPRTWRN